MALKERITQIDEIWSARAELEDTKEKLIDSQNLPMDSCLFSLWPRENCFLVIVEMLVTCFPCSCSSLEGLTVAKHVIEGSTCSVGFLVKEYLNAQIT